MFIKENNNNNNKKIWIPSPIAGIAQNGQKHLKFPVAPQVRMKIRETGKQEKKNMRVDKSKENTLKYFHMYIYTYHGHTNICKHRYTYSHIHITCYSSQIVLIGEKNEKWTFFASISLFSFIFLGEFFIHQQFMAKPHTSAIRMTYEYIRVT